MVSFASGLDRSHSLRRIQNLDCGKLHETVIAPPTPFDAALANAVYNMVERADELQADAVIFVRTKTKITDDKGKRTVSVHISGLAVKLK
ncbi:heavy metal-binding domain-containing protein [Treponema socranskii]|uniref:heavy metal-binding domain-containing protein n=1 Tax=Treponema socranskii TaxID=53419 RepID=UPI003605B212